MASSSTFLPLPVSVKQIYNSNFKSMFEEFKGAAKDFPIIAVETEFSGFDNSASEYSGAYDVYEQMKSNMSLIRLIQIGFALSDEDGKLYCEEDGIPIVWHFNLKFDISSDPHVKEIIDALENRDVDFKMHKDDGIPCSIFVGVFVPWLMDNSHTWVFFHGNYDMALLITNFLKSVTIPDDIREFYCLISGYFGDRVYDVKMMAAHCKLFYMSEKLSVYATHLGVPPYGTKHQAGSDALVILLVYHRLKKLLSVDCANELFQLWPC